MSLKSCAPFIYSRSLGIPQDGYTFHDRHLSCCYLPVQVQKNAGKVLGVATSLITPLGPVLVVKHKLVVSCIAI